MDDPISLSIKARGKNKSGLQVKLREDGYYYICKVPKGMKDCAVGDRVLEINGVKSERFKGEGSANDLIDTFQLEIIPVDGDEGYATTDDELDFDLEDEESSPQTTTAAAAPVAQKVKKAAAGAVGQKKGPGRRENVEYLDESDSDEDVPQKGEKNRGMANAVPNKPLQQKGRGRRDTVEYVDDDDDDDDDDEVARPQPKFGKGNNEKGGNTKKEEGSRSTPNSSAKPARGRREEVEYLDDEDDDVMSSEDEEYEEVVRPRPGVRGKPVQAKPENVPVKTVSDESDDDSEEEEYEEVSRPRPSSGRARSVPVPVAQDDEVGGNGEHDDESSVSRSDDEYEEDEDYDAPRKPLSQQSLRHALAKKQDSKRSLYRPSPEDFDRPYVSNYQPMDRWMVTVKKDEDQKVGISIVQHKKELFVTDVEEGPFFKTALDKGDKILSINGKKVPKQITSVTEAEEIMEGKTKLTVFVLRPDREKDPGYQWVMDNF